MTDMFFLIQSLMKIREIITLPVLIINKLKAYVYFGTYNKFLRKSYL